jgi:hypothetical protein
VATPSFQGSCFITTCDGRSTGARFDERASALLRVAVAAPDGTHKLLHAACFRVAPNDCPLFTDRYLQAADAPRNPLLDPAANRLFQFCVGSLQSLVNDHRPFILNAMAETLTVAPSKRRAKYPNWLFSQSSAWFARRVFQLTVAYDGITV